LSWAGMEWLLRGKPTSLGAVSGMVAGLATITQGSGFVSVPAALLIGFTAGIVCYLAVAKLKNVLGYDDSLDAFGVHGLGGIMGALSTGLLASAAVNPAIANTYKSGGSVVSLAGGAAQFSRQATAALAAIVLSVVMSYIILKTVDLLVGLRPTVQDEDAGLDLTQHGEEAYNA
jgi:ammonium transporter, Amt family